MKTKKQAIITTLNAMRKFSELTQTESTGLRCERPCPKCGNLHKFYAYNSEWCDDCLYSEAYLPASYQDEETRLLYSLFFARLSARGEWIELRRLAVFFEENRESFLAGHFELDVAKMIQEAGERMCCSECGGKFYMGRSYGGFCSHRCYMRMYRRENADRVNELQRERRKVEDREPLQPGPKPKNKPGRQYAYEIKG